MATELQQQGITSVLISDAAAYAIMPVVTKVVLSNGLNSHIIYTGEWGTDSS